MPVHRLGVKRTTPYRLWTPPGRTQAQVRNSRVRIVVSVVLLAGALLGLAVMALS